MQSTKGRTFLCICWAILSLVACNADNVKPETQLGKTTIVPLKYAKGFEIRRTPEGQMLTIFNPWHGGEIFARYTLGQYHQVLNSMSDQKLTAEFSEIGAFSSTAIGYLKLLHREHTITGITDGAHIYDSVLFAKYASGIVKGLGQNMVDNFEAILDLNPDALIKSGFEQSPTQDARYLKAGIPVIYVNDWMESQPLARAEWIKFIACFAGKYELADSIFNEIEARYLSVKEKALAISDAPRVMAGGEYKGTWYVPGGKSYFANFLADAKADYTWKQDTSVGSLALSLEPVVEKDLEDEFWFTTHDLSAEELIAMDERYKLFRCVREQNLYTYTKRVSPNGGNDYWESGVCRPDLILQDLVTILHPEHFQAELYYYRRLGGTDLNNSK